MRQPSAAFFVAHPSERWLTHRNGGSPLRNPFTFARMAHPWRMVAHLCGMMALSHRNNQFIKFSQIATYFLRNCP